MRFQTAFPASSPPQTARARQFYSGAQTPIEVVCMNLRKAPCLRYWKNSWPFLPLQTLVFLPKTQYRFVYMQVTLSPHHINTSSNQTRPYEFGLLPMDSHLWKTSKEGISMMWSLMPLLFKGLAISIKPRMAVASRMKHS